MDEAGFWGLIEQAKERSGGDCERQVESIAEELSTLPPEEIIEFDRILDRLRTQSYRNDLWAACYIINGGCSDDGFDYFRGWLIEQGRDAFEAALRDPETLADIAEFEEADCESMLYVARQAYESKTGEEMPWPEPHQLELVGPEWDEDSLPGMYPRLWEKTRA